jgi:hypothetical protein
MLDQVKDLTEGVKKAFKNGAGSGVDRLHLVTSLLLLLYAAAYFGRGLAQEPIVCFAPAHWPSAWVKSADGACYNGQLYAHPFNKYQPLPSASVREDRRVSFHRYAMWIAIGQACLYILPGLLWKRAYRQNSECC